jgi:uncharacterized repeat protein (TIGR02543 family)
MKIYIALILGTLALLLRPASAQTELMVNGGFESSTLAPWAIQGSPSAALKVLSGTNQYAGSQCALLANGNGYIQNLYQTITFPTNLIAATFSFYYNIISTDPIPFDATLSVYITDVNGNVLLNIGEVSNLNISGGYVQSSDNLVTYTGAPNLTYAGKTVQVHFAAATDGYGAYTQFYLDDVSMQVATTANIPANDDFTNLTALTGSTNNLFANNTYATKEPGEPNHAGNAGGHSLWWSWLAPTNGIVTLNNFGSSFQTLLAVYTGGVLTNLTPVASSINGSATAVTFKATAGTTYDIAVDGYNGATGNIVLYLALSPDVTPPKVSITAPANGANVTSSFFLLQGKASDNVAVAQVQYRLENAAGTNAYQAANGTTNWSATVTNLIPGANTVRVLAFDTSGNVSPAVAISVNYVIVAPLTLGISGGGTVSGATNGQLFHVGVAYKITAVPKTGFGFAGWTGDVITNTPALTFVMQSNLTLQASFVDITRPTVTITNPAKTGAKWSNAVFNVSGKAGDNVLVTNVSVSLNRGAWMPATLSNHGSNWVQQVNLMAGTNTLAAYAADSSGNFSLTNTVNVIYIVSAPLTVQIMGSGTLSPNYNNALLAISNNYTMKATAGTGFAFAYWSGGVSMSTSPTLNFTMVSNLTIIANFNDITKPATSITFPVASQKWSNTVITVTGKASDNVGVSGVGVQFNGGGWLAAQSANGYTNWTAANLPVIFGTNIVQAYAMDAAGNVSLTNTVKFLGVVAPLTLSGYAATLKPSVGKQELVMTWGNDTYAQTGAGTDTNASDYHAGSYEYVPTGPTTALLGNVDIGMLNALGVTNVTTMGLTFTGPSSAGYTWTNQNNSGAGTMTFSPVSNLVPATLAGRMVQIFAKTTLVTTIALNNDGSFNATNSAGGHYGTYDLAQFTPTVAVLHQNFTDPTDAGGDQYLVLTFTTTNAGSAFGSYYGNPAYGSNPSDIGVGTFKVQ